MKITLSADVTPRARNKPSLYADPLAWAVADFIEPFYAGLDERKKDNIGLIVVSDVCSLESIRFLSSAAQTGRISPLKFAGANPGIVAGLAAVLSGSRGPTLVLSMKPEFAELAVKSVAKFWTRCMGIDHVICVFHQTGCDQSKRLAALLIDGSELEYVSRCVRFLNELEL